MKAVRFHGFGDSDVLVYEDLERPVAGAGEVVVKVAGTSFNPVDAAVRAGILREVLPVPLPRIPGMDMTGTIAEIGDGVTGWNVGDAVVALLPVTGDGAAREYVAVAAAELAAAPRTVDLVDAAALPTVGLTAWQALFDHAGLRAGQRVLINGAGSAVGGYAVQLAQEAGATVVATAGPRSAERVRARGADEVIDYTVTSAAKAVTGRFDVVLNLAFTSPEEIAELIGLVVDDGVLITTTGTDEEAGRGVRATRMFVHGDAAQLAGLVERVDDGRLVIDVAERSTLTGLPDVHRRADAGELAGKTVVAVG
ncbi:NADP-dependent oxidoreductase [Spirillospora sp. NPDC047279]|uniref:NADP-dependent oxidoreductase n=1 Tax=Spirillospora sp. NPDC047279 TaxID=3155478 RepID=UPI0033E4E631